MCPQPDLTSLPTNAGLLRPAAAQTHLSPRTAHLPSLNIHNDVSPPYVPITEFGLHFAKLPASTTNTFLSCYATTAHLSPFFLAASSRSASPARKAAARSCASACAATAATNAAATAANCSDARGPASAACSAKRAQRQTLGPVRHGLHTRSRECHEQLDAGMGAVPGFCKCLAGRFAACGLRNNEKKAWKTESSTVWCLTPRICAATASETSLLPLVRYSSATSREMGCRLASASLGHGVVITSGHELEGDSGKRSLQLWYYLPTTVGQGKRLRRRMRCLAK